MPTDTATPVANLYVTLPHDETRKPEVYTSILDRAPRATPTEITEAAQARITLAANRTDEDNCHDCRTPIGYHFIADTDPERFVNTGFYITPTGTALCEECGE